MKQNLIFATIIAVCIITIGLNSSCNKTKEPAASKQEDMTAAIAMDAQMDNLYLYHDSVVYAHLHNPLHQHHYDSIFHHHDSIYHHHHNNYHHGDTTHHHNGWHHTPAQHYHHDSLINAHHAIFH